MIDEFKKAGVDPQDVFAQSFNKNDILYWIKHEPRFGRQAVYLDDIDPTASPPLPRISLDELRQLRRAGVQIIAPPIFALLAVDSHDRIVPSQYALDIKNTGFDIITWSFERADLRKGAGPAGFYYLSLLLRELHGAGVGNAVPAGHTEVCPPRAGCRTLLHNPFFRVSSAARCAYARAAGCGYRSRGPGDGHSASHDLHRRGR